MFYDCESLTGINLNSFNISNVSAMLSMFEVCTNLKDLDLKNFGTDNKINYVGWIFYNCRNLQSIDLRDFNLRGDSYANIQSAFENAGVNKSIPIYVLTSGEARAFGSTTGFTNITYSIK